MCDLETLARIEEALREMQRKAGSR
jgi:hypothetical protein